MKFERTPAELEVELRITGFGRFVSAAFLAVWMTGWVVGETFALWILSVGAWSLLTGQPPAAGRELLRPEAALPAGLFLLLWLGLWTLGGLAAGRELLRSLFGRDRIRAGVDDLEVEHSSGLFRSRRHLRQDEIRRFYRKPGSAALCVETTGGVVELTRLGTAEDRVELLQALTAHFQTSALPASEGALPEGWCEVPSLERDTVLVKNPATRRKQALTMWIVCILITSAALAVISAAWQNASQWGGAAIMVFFAVLTAWGAIWLSFGRNEWRLEQGRVVLQRRFGSDRATKFEAVALEFVEDNSGEDGPSYLLVAVAADAPARPYTNSVGKHRHIIYQHSDDPVEPRNFGRWLNQRCQLPLADLTTAEAKAREFEELKQRLASSGRLGRAALHLITRLIPAQQRPDAGE